ncbi:MAG: DUF488 domain-containing protein [Candidatus Omnitrophica bacterium]|nr:DUF488 domain-containing protein [Candidatus Omnitrophota bacterium]
MKPKINIKRIYDHPDKKDGLRVLVDRLWPRGVRKDEAGVDVWAKDLAPSTDLRKWFGHDPKKWEQFTKRYTAELKLRQDEIKGLLSQWSDQQTITLLYAAKSETHNHALVLMEFLKQTIGYKC